MAINCEWICRSSTQTPNVAMILMRGIPQPSHLPGLVRTRRPPLPIWAPYLTDRPFHRTKTRPRNSMRGPALAALSPSPVPTMPVTVPQPVLSRSVRQPCGPPSGADELSSRNFMTHVRRKAVGGLGALMDARERCDVIRGRYRERQSDTNIHFMGYLLCVRLSALYTRAGAQPLIIHKRALIWRQLHISTMTKPPKDSFRGDLIQGCG